MQRSNLSRYLAELALLLIAVIWGAAFVAQRTAMQHLGPFAFNGLRFLLAALVIWAVVIAAGRLKRIGLREIVLGCLLGTVLFAGASLQQVGVVTTSAGKAGFITGLYIVLIPLFLRIFWRQKTSAYAWYGIVAAVSGLFLLSVGADFSLQRGDVWVTLCAIAFAWHMILTGRLVQNTDPWILAAIQFTVMAFASLVVAEIREPFTVNQVSLAWGEILYAGVLSAGVGYTGQTVAQKYTSSVITGIILSLESVFAALTGWLLLGEMFTSRQILGCVLMLIGTVLAQVSEKRDETDAPNL